jgi:hypothetical protein
VLHAYLDDSGSHAQSPVLILAGYFGSETQWNKFDRRWRNAIDTEGLKEFHANRFWAHYTGKPIPEYKGWDKRRCNQFIVKLVGIICSHRIFPVSSTVVMQDWGALPKDERAVLTGAGYDDSGKLTSLGAPNKSYFVPFLWSVHSALRYCNPGHVMNFSFDRNDFISGYATNYFRIVKKPWAPQSPKLGELFFVDSERSSPIQAADLLAYETHKYINARINRSMRPLNFSSVLGKALQNKRDDHDFLLLDKKGLDLMLTGYRATRAKNP